MKKKILYGKYAIVIILLLLIIVPTTHAIYKNRVVGSSALSLANWSVSLNQIGVNDHLVVVSDPNEIVANYTLNINATSEVSFVYSIVIDNMPSGTSVSLDGGNFYPETNHKVTINNVGTVLYSDQNKSKTHTLTFKAGSTAPYVDDQEISVDVVVKQKL